MVIRDDNKIDNRRSNLRFLTNRENCCNKRQHQGKKPKVSKYIGVYLNRNKQLHKKWFTSIFMGGKNFFFGGYKTEEEAHNVYVNKIRELGVSNRISVS